ncbi:MAG: glycoside hydrolase family 43 protein [bacterium]|nr:glycoside hydrolase family 43 protein [bacterium]
MEISNPILPGFNPDPSIIKVNDTYYIATSTFEWYPGVQIHKSKNLKNWQLIQHPLVRDSQLNMLGSTYSMGVWAPCLSYDSGTFYLIYTNAKQAGITHNYLVTTTDIEGIWSDPIYLHSRGFDPSLFHDDNGKTWLLSMYFDHLPWSMFVDLNKNLIKNKANTRILEQYNILKKEKPLFKGIIIQEYDKKIKKLIGKPKKIFNGSKIGITEGPHLYKKNGYYYLLTAEGGTSYGHCVTLARSKQLLGKYEIHPKNPIMRAEKHDYLQKTGHADILMTEDIMVYLCSRPLDTKNKKGSILGRETAICKVSWDKNNWLNVKNKKLISPKSNRSKTNPMIEKTLLYDDFTSTKLNTHFQWLRGDIFNEIASLQARPNYLRLLGKEMITSNFKQSLIATRQISFSYEATTVIEFEPNNENQMAGLSAFYCNELFYYAYIGYDQKIGKFLSIMTNDLGDINLFQTPPIPISEYRIYLKAKVDHQSLQFYYSLNEENWFKLGIELDMFKLSDEYSSGFTGAFIALACQDPIGMKKHADFDYLKINFFYNKN